MIRVNLSKAHSSKEPVECWYDLEDYYFLHIFLTKWYRSVYGEYLDIL